MPVTDIQGLIDNRVVAVKKYHKDAGVPRAELDLSGGLDSAVMAGILTLAVGPERLTLVHSRIDTNPKQTARAQALADGLGVPMANGDYTRICDHLIKEAVNSLVNGVNRFSNGPTSVAHSPGESFRREIQERINKDPTIIGSIRSCLRAPIGRACNRLMGGGIRHGTGNECEDRFLRYYQKGGDGEVDTNPLAMLSKTEVFQLAWGLGERFPEARQAYTDTIKAKPSADLWGSGDDHTDEDEVKRWLKVPFTYGSIDPETGRILSFGTIERVSRLLDCRMTEFTRFITIEDLLFGSSEPTNYNWENMKGHAILQRCFKLEQHTLTEIQAFLKAARKAEAATRHKLNPNIPTLGTRQDLVEQKLLNNELKLEVEA